MSASDSVCYIPDFLSTRDADLWLQRIENAMCWVSESLTMYGRCIQVPREVAWCGERGLNYRYSGLDHPASGWPGVMIELKERVEAACAMTFNFVLANRYSDGADYMGWHRDDEPGMAHQVASLSLGDERRFLMRDDGETRSRRLTLGHGSLLMFDGAVRHSLPRCAHAQRRINLTFRSLSGPDRT